MMMMIMMMMMMIVNLYSALRRAPLLRYVSRCIVKRNVFIADRKYFSFHLSVGLPLGGARFL